MTGLMSAVATTRAYADDPAWVNCQYGDLDRLNPPEDFLPRSNYLNLVGSSIEETLRVHRKGNRIRGQSEAEAIIRDQFVVKNIQEFSPLISKIARVSYLPPAVVTCVPGTESHFVPHDTSDAGAEGYWQLTRSSIAEINQWLKGKPLPSYIARKDAIQLKTIWGSLWESIGKSAPRSVKMNDLNNKEKGFVLGAFWAKVTELALFGGLSPSEPRKPHVLTADEWKVFTVAYNEGLTKFSRQCPMTTVNATQCWKHLMELNGRQAPPKTRFYDETKFEAIFIEQCVSSEF